MSVETYNVGALLKAQAQRRGDQAALVMREGGAWRTVTFAELDRHSDRFASGLLDKGLCKGDRIVLLIKPSVDFYAFLFGLIKMGAVPVLVDPGMGLKNVLKCIEEIRPKALAALSAVHAVATFVRKPFRTATLRITAGRRWFWGGETLQTCLGPDAPYSVPPSAATDEVGIVFTSGSTGTPKGVSYTHGVFHAVATIANERIGRIPGTPYLECFAAYVLFDVAQGMTAVVPDVDLSKPAKADPNEIIRAVVDHGCTAGFASPAILRNLWRHCAETGTQLPTLTNMLTGVAPIDAGIHHGLAATSPGAKLHVVYGATEGMTVAHTDSTEVLGETWSETEAGAGTCVGTPFDETDVRIIAITDEPLPTWSSVVEMADGQIGEICIRGAVVSPEYKERPEANAKSKIADGDSFWHRTGDLGYRGERGRLWFCGRKAHRVETAGGMVPSVPVEGVFNADPTVKRTALVAVGTAGRQRAVLCVEADGPVDSTKLLKRADATRWARVVDEVRVHPGFPVDARHNSKIKREVLAQWAANQPR